MTTKQTDIISDGAARQRLTFLGFTDADAQILRSLKSWAEGVVQGFSKEFYTASFKDSGFADFVKQAGGTRAGLEQAQASYCMDLFNGWPDAGYLEKRTRIGTLHAKIGVKPEFYISSYQFYFDFFYPLVRKHLRTHPGKGNQALAAIKSLSDNSEGRPG